MKRAVATFCAATFLFASAAQAGSSAELFIEQAYAPWVNPALKRISDTELMSPEFMELWRADDAAAEKVGEVGVIDGNLICSCQDGQMTNLNITVREISASRASAHVTFAMDGMARDQIMLLKMAKGRWFIDDILIKNTSLRAELRQDARMRLKRPSKSRN